jgi:hypothetical protein
VRAYQGFPINLQEPTADELEAGERRFDYEGPEWAISGRVRDEEGGPHLLSLEIRPADPDGAVSAALVRGVPVGKIIASLRTLLSIDRSEREAFGPARSSGYEYTPLAGNPPKTPRRGGKPTVSDEHLRAVAEAYLAETAPGQPSRPLLRLAEKFGSPEETVRTWVARARKEGWLAPGVKGRAGGEPGPKLLTARLADELELGPHPEDEPLAEKMAREARRMRKINEGVEKWEQMRRGSGGGEEPGVDEQ